ncbi:MAG: hypothetical protein ACJAYU_003780 [Bradymonadia bacterium]|jgi:hypothetical protein
MKQSLQDTSAWIFQVWTSFTLSFGASVAGIIYLPVDAWIRSFMGMSLLATVMATFTLAKTVRDNQESSRLINRVQEAKTEALLREFETEVTV